jgi:hypothetical protein
MILMNRLRSYEGQLTRILGNFEEGPSSYDMKSSDETRYAQIVIEMRDLLQDNFPKADYAEPVMSAYDSGRLSGSPSYESVEQIRTLIKAAITRVERNPAFAKRKSSNPLSAPDKVTLAWLIEHVPVKLWLAGFGILGATYLLGVKTSHLWKALGI